MKLTEVTGDELGQFWDAGMMFYATDFWSAWDLAIITIGLVYAVMSTYLKIIPHTRMPPTLGFAYPFLAGWLLVREAAQ